MRISRLIQSLATFGLLSGLTQIAHANLLTNGSFEQASVDPGAGAIEVFPGQTSITGWNIGAEDVRYIGTDWKASDGIRSIFLESFTTYNFPESDITSYGAVSQTFATVPGNTYEVTFDIAEDATNQLGAYFAAATVSADGQSGIFYGPMNDGSDMLWGRGAWSFVADDTSATLQFQSYMDYNGWPTAIDNVVVTAVPEPSAYAMMLAGLGLIGFAVRR